jgi:hypothetical protein
VGGEAESESLRVEAWWLVTRPLLHQAGSRVRTPELDNLKWDRHTSQGCLQTPDPSSENVACGAAGASRLMMKASCSFGGILDPASRILDLGRFVSGKGLLIRAVRQSSYSSSLDQAPSAAALIGIRRAGMPRTI